MSTATKERPILMRPELVRAILAGKKSQTRRPVKPQPDWPDEVTHANVGPGPFAWPIGSIGQQCGHPIRAKYEVGMRLWVRETWHTNHLQNLVHYRADWGPDWDPFHPDKCGDDCALVGEKWRPNIHMPRWASRITLEVTDARIERLQSISEEDAAKEGLEVQYGDGGAPGAGCKWDGPGYWDTVSRHYDHGGKTFHVAETNGTCCCYEGHRLGLTPAKCAFRILWDSINAKRGCGWDENPWLWAVEFRRVKSE